MTEPIAVDVPAKPLAVTPPSKPEPPKAVAKAEPSKPPFAKPPVAAAPPATLLQRFARNKAGIGAAALFSLAAGIAGVRLIWPEDDTPPQSDAAAKQPQSPGSPPGPRITEEGTPSTIPPPNVPTGPVAGGSVPAVASPTPGAPVAPPSVPPSLPTAEEPSPQMLLAMDMLRWFPDFAAAARSPAARGGDSVQTKAGDTLPPPAIPSATPPAARGDGFGATRGSETGIPPLPPDLVPPVVTVGGTTPQQEPKNDRPTVPALPGTPQIDPKVDPKNETPAPPKLDPIPLPKNDPPGTGGMIPTPPPPKLDLTPRDDTKSGGMIPTPPATGDIILPKLPGTETPKKDPEKKVQGEPVSPLPPPAIGGPNSGTGGGTPPIPPVLPMGGGSGGTGVQIPDLSAPPPRKLPGGVDSQPGAGGSAGSGTRIEFTKPAGGTTAANDRQPTTTYDVDIYSPKSGDSWESISREFYGDPRFATALSTYNRGQLAKSRPVDIPPLHVVKKYLPTPATPAGGFGSGSAPDWGASTPPARGAAEKPFVVPTGGMSMRGIAKLVLGTEQRWEDIYNLNPHLRPDTILQAGTELKLPPDARVP